MHGIVGRGLTSDLRWHKLNSFLAGKLGGGKQTIKWDIQILEHDALLFIELPKKTFNKCFSHK